jgi:hypothetical protein
MHFKFGEVNEAATNASKVAASFSSPSLILIENVSRCQRIGNKVEFL